MWHYSEKRLSQNKPVSVTKHKMYITLAMEIVSNIIPNVSYTKICKPVLNLWLF